MYAVRARPSALALTIACNASLPLQELVEPLPPTDEEAEGTAAHFVARRYLAGFGRELPVGAKFTSDGREWTVDDDMYAGAMLYARTVGIHPDNHIEEWVAVTRVHESECAGTPDAWRFFNDARDAYPECPPGIPLEKFNAGKIKLLRVPDYKFGHRYVEVFENPQLSAYATGVLDKLEIHDDSDLYVELMLVQPRSYHTDGPVRIWRVQAQQLRGLLNIMHHAVGVALGPHALATTGRHCLDCRARHECEALRKNTLRLVDYAHSAERTQLPPDALGQELLIVQDAIKQLEAREAGLAGQAEVLIRMGKAIPHYSLKPGRSNLTYFENCNADELVSLGELCGIDIRKKLERKDLVVTPTQAIQLGIAPEVMANYASRPPGKQKLTRDNTTAVRKVFAK